MNLLDRFIVPGLALVAALALVLAGWQWLRAERALVAAANTRTELADYIGQVQRNAAEAGQKARVAEQKARFLQQEALDAEFLARVAAQADLDALRDSHGQLQRYSTDLASSLDRAGAPAPAASGSGTPAVSAGRVLADMLGRIDAAAAEIATFADSSRRAGQLCERSYDALIVEPVP